jgi:hypothetical protein
MNSWRVIGLSRKQPSMRLVTMSEKRREMPVQYLNAWLHLNAWLRRRAYVSLVANEQGGRRRSLNTPLDE